MNQTKLILSMLRDGNFAHPGEIEAIELAMQPLHKISKQTILDVGCGLGATTHYLQQNNFGTATGIDIDKNAINHAKKHYNECQFFQTDVLQVAELFSTKKFDLFSLFSSFYCFPQQQQSLLNLSTIANPGAQVVIFDYSKYSSDNVKNPFTRSTSIDYFYPIYLDEFHQTLANSGWELTKSMDISELFKKWYMDLLDKFTKKRAPVLAKFEESLYQAMYNGYSQLLTDIQENKLGGILVYATKI